MIFRPTMSAPSGSLTEAGRRAVEEDYAESLILGCTLEIGFNEKLSETLGVPVVDPSIAALKRAEYGSHPETRLRHDSEPRKWSCEPPPEEEIARFGIIGDADVLGNRIVVEAE